MAITFSISLRHLDPEIPLDHFLVNKRFDCSASLKLFFHSVLTMETSLMVLVCVFACHLTEVRYKHRKIRRRELSLFFLHYGKAPWCHRAADFFVFLGSPAFIYIIFFIRVGVHESVGKTIMPSNIKRHRIGDEKKKKILDGECG